MFVHEGTINMKVRDRQEIIDYTSTILNGYEQEDSYIVY